MKRFGLLLILLLVLLAGRGSAQEAPVFEQNWAFQTPPSAVWRRTVDDDWRDYASLTVDVQLEGGKPDQELLCSVFFETKQDWWFETRKAVRLDGDGYRFHLRLDDTSPDWQAPQLRRGFGPDVLRWVRHWGIKIFTVEPVQGVLKISKLTLTPVAARQVPRIVDLEMPEAPSVNRLAPVRFRLANFRGDSFDPDVIRVRMDWTGKRKQGHALGFFRQDFQKLAVPGQPEPHLVPRKLPVWQVNWRPPATGKYQLRLTIEGPAEEAITQRLPDVRVVDATAAASTDEKGEQRFLTRNAERRVFVFRDGDWRLPAGAATAAAYWQTQLAWTSAWGHYQGLGVYDQQVAWELERQIRKGDPGQPRPLLLFGEDELDNHGTFNWVDHPLNAANGGPLADRNAWFESPAVRAMLKQRARYLWARYGALPQVSGLLINLPRPYDSYIVWLSSLARELVDECPGLRLLCDNPGLPARVNSTSLDLYDKWQVDRRLADFTFISTDDLRKEVLIEGRYPGTTAVLFNKQVQHWGGGKVFAVDIKTSEAAGNEVKAMCFIRTDPHTVFQTQLQWLREDDWNRIYFPLDDPSAWACLSDTARELAPWDLLNIKEVGLRFFCDQPNEVILKVRNCRILDEYEIDRAAAGPLAVQALTGNVDTVGQYERFELDFQLNREFRNPYDPRQVDVSIAVSDPQGALLQHPGFYYEPWRLQMRENREVVDRPVEKPSWKLRFTPSTPGPHRWILTVRTSEETARVSGTFECEPRDSKGFVRISEQDPRMFEFSDGSFFFPIGHNLRSPSDRRPGIYRSKSLENADWADRMGTHAYEAWFAKMAANGENFSRIWMCPWWAGLEWKASYPGYHGLGFYNQQNAVRLDRLLRLARKHRIYLNLETLNHGALSTGIDNDWRHNPLSEQQPGGFLRYATDFFQSEQALRLHRQKLRYTIARWGYSPQIAIWGIITESEWVEPYFRSEPWARPSNARAPWVPQPYRTERFVGLMREWLEETGRYLKRTDAHPHVVTTHFSTPRSGNEMWARDALEVVHNNAYTMFTQYWQTQRFKQSRGVADIIHEYGKYFRRWDGKPLIIGEWGGHSQRNRESHLLAELHTGLWASFMTDLSGITGYWWWNLLDAHDQYKHFAAIAKFAAGEDRRGKEYHSVRGRVDFAGGRRDYSRRAALMLHSKNELFAYIYHRNINTHKESVPPKAFDDPAFPESGLGQLRLPQEFAAGRYRVEYWDTFAGKPFRTATIDIDDDDRLLLLPSHRVDLAVKLKPQPAADQRRAIESGPR